MRLSLLLLLTLLSFGRMAEAISVRNLTDEHHLSGPKLTEAQLNGKVIVVEAWGINCSICHHIMKDTGDIQRDFAKDENVVFIYSHVQGRNDKRIHALLKDHDYTGPVYQMFSVEGAPSFRGIPFAYIFNHKGECVWSGYPANQKAAFVNAIKDASKAVPKHLPGSLLSGMDIVHNKNVLRALIAGRNVEPTLKQLRAKAARGGEAGTEAAAILERCTAWSTQMEEAITAAIEETPSKALVDFKLYQRTFPSKAKQLAPEVAPLAKDKNTTRLATIRQTLDKLSTAKADTPNARKQLLGKVKQQLRALKTLQVEEGNTDYADVEAKLQSLADTLTD